MNFKTTITTVAASMVLSCSAFASPIMSPSKCPSVQSIKSTSFIRAELFEQHIYTLTQASSYDTDYHWEFIFGPIIADNEQDALEKGKEKINCLQGALEPSKLEDAWICSYMSQDEQGLSFGLAVYEEGSVVTPGKMKSILKTKF